MSILSPWPCIQPSKYWFITGARSMAWWVTGAQLSASLGFCCVVHSWGRCWGALTLNCLNEGKFLLATEVDCTVAHWVTAYLQHREEKGCSSERHMAIRERERSFKLIFWLPFDVKDLWAPWQCLPQHKLLCEFCPCFFSFSFFFQQTVKWIWKCHVWERVTLKCKPGKITSQIEFCSWIQSMKIEKLNQRTEASHYSTFA